MSGFGPHLSLQPSNLTWTLLSKHVLMGYYEILRGGGIVSMDMTRDTISAISDIVEFERFGPLTFIPADSLVWGA